MKFPKQVRPGTEAHADACHQLDEARHHQRHMREALDASRHTPGEQAAVTDLAAATETAAAREAWVSWTERDY